MARVKLQASAEHEDVWWSVEEYRASVGAAANMAGKAFNDMFDQLTEELIEAGILRKERRFGVPGYAFTKVAVVVTPISGGH